MVKLFSTVTAWRTLTHVGLDFFCCLLLLPQLTLAASLWSERLTNRRDHTSPPAAQCLPGYIDAETLARQW